MQAGDAFFGFDMAGEGMVEPGGVNESGGLASGLGRSRIAAAEQRRDEGRKGTGGAEMAGVDQAGAVAGAWIASGYGIEMDGWMEGVDWVGGGMDGRNRD